MTATPWTFSIPTTIRFGCGVAKELPAIARQYGRRPIVVTGSRLAGDALVAGLRDALDGAPLFSGVTPNPTVEQVDALARIIRDEHRDVVVAIGGGSPIDCAKAASALAVSDAASIREFHSGGRALGSAHLPLVAVPTTAGTGTEVTPISVLDDPAANIKAPLAAPALYPVSAVVDPELTVSMPRFTTAATALDALAHALEGYWSRNHQPICDLAAREAARLVLGNLAAVLENPSDLEGRAALSRAALLGGLAFQLPKNAMVHACAFPLASRHHLAHGTACALTLEFAIRFNAEAIPERLNAFAQYCGFDSPNAVADEVGKLKRLGGLPCSLSEAGILAEAVPQLIDESFHPLIKNNPREVTRQDLERMYAELA